MEGIRSFASDNNAGASPEILEAIVAANRNHAVAYGDDPWTEGAKAAFAKEFGDRAKTLFVFNGTGANVLGLSLVTRPGQSVLCAEGAHIAVDEAGAPEAAGLKILPLRSSGGKIGLDAIEGALGVLGNIHHSQPACVSLSEPTELGTLYDAREIASIAKLVHSRGLRLHVDGARIANAAVALGLSFKELLVDTGVDLVSFGGMKNGIAFGEALVILDPGIADGAEALRKTRLQLASKMRFVAAQYIAYLDQGIWRRNAERSNAAALRLAGLIKAVPGVELAREPETNGLFARLPAKAAEKLRERFFFYDWEGGLVRWMTSFDTSEEDIAGFVETLRASLAEA
jgi:threonine aldolase